MERLVIEADENHHFSIDQAMISRSNDLHREANDLQEMKDRVSSALSELELDERIMVEEIYFEDLPHKTVAEHLGSSPAKVRTKIHRIRRKLHRLMNARRDHPLTNGRSAEELE